MKRSKYKVDLHYQVKQNDLTIFRTDMFFITPTQPDDPLWKKTEQQKTMSYLSRFIRKEGSECDIHVEEISVNGLDECGVERIKYTPVKLFLVKDDAVMVRNWWTEKSRFFDGFAKGPERAIKELKETLEIW